MDSASTSSKAARPLSPAPPRSVRLARLKEERFDLLVVGGGITGAGVARDAAMRGLSVALVDKGDWAGGTSSRSSRLVHGGLRYLENLELGLVFESLRERHRQLSLNPHLVRPIPFVLPVYEGAPVGLWKLNIGLWLYDLLSLLRAPGLHRRLGAARTVELVPQLRREGLKGAVRYYDCRTDDARLTLANVLAAESRGAAVASYAAYDGPLRVAGRAVGARVTDRLGGDSFDVRADETVFALGPWTDTVAEVPGDGELLRPTKGVHIVLPRERLPLDVAIGMTSVTDGRVVFAVPSGDVTYVGTTDTDFRGDLDDVRPTADDVAYLLATADRYFPESRLRREDIRSTWASLRPLIRSDADSAYRTSREHRVFAGEREQVTVAGGKLTTYRAMAEEVVDAVVARTRHRGSGRRFERCRTAEVPLDPALPPAPEDPDEHARWSLHGSGIGWLAERLAAHPEEAERPDAALPYCLAQVSWALAGEHAERLEDLMSRRLQFFYRAPDQGLAAARPVAAHMAARAGHDAAWIDGEVARYQDLVAASREGSGDAPS